ncbi:hypothetical protein [Kerstersia gyiorum]|uniref:hypothetical protein n=1 Tax=Kerstersia gyiorum TaxID=206506 RepID=UPI0020A1434C|nr:hypothetical protein [Kerstersia gyiorum]MCP1638281.1 hypothetical protein [Kerstersia gyiorum]MCP1672881.1 hypothetical protein [Kerstersia gyiorum]MCP1710785.1 hypothetical protein [Kerstersia gyiorum]
MQKFWYFLAVVICSILTAMGALFAIIFVLSLPEMVGDIGETGVSTALDTAILSFGVMALSWWQYRYRHVVYPQFKRSAGEVGKGV